MRTGFCFYLNGKDYFVETERQNKTRKFASGIVKALGHETSDGNIDFILSRLRHATLEVKHCKGNPANGIEPFSYYDIKGDGFGGCGSRVDDGKTVILEVA